ncbi:MAG: DUF928 domain-containing protein [Moorea sp. SIO2B7]|nr:DUF928 domain-containing protein [Moorena sp. SIO2B7]
MKFCKNSLYFGLSLVLVMGITPPGLALLSGENFAELEVKTDVLLARTRRRLYFRRRNLRARGFWRPGATRGSCPLPPGEKVTALIPPDVKKDDSGNLTPDKDKYGRYKYGKNLSYTVSSAPTVFFYIPEINKKATNHLKEAEFVTAELVLKDKDKNKLHKTKVKLPNQSGIVSLTLSEDPAFPNLEVGKSYQWDLTIICTPTDWKSNPKVGGWIHRLDPNSSLAPQYQASSDNIDNVNVDDLEPGYIIADELKITETDDHPSVYAEANIWYDTLSSLARLIKANPDDSSIKEDWQNLLTDVGHEAIASKRLVGDATIIESKRLVGDATIIESD